MMTSLAAQIIDQQVSGIVERHADLLAGELRLGNDERKIEAAEVLVRIYELERHDDALVEAITFATNSQNPVILRDLRANDRRQQDLATSISGLGYRYRTKREDRAPAADDAEEIGWTPLPPAAALELRGGPDGMLFRGVLEDPRPDPLTHPIHPTHADPPTRRELDSRIGVCYR